ncbi:MAG: response regulator [Betaproteobacteria bacterium]|nr:response regulator [Betaproteobacteria bacterium]
MNKIILVVTQEAGLRKQITMTLDFGDYDLHEAEDGMRGLYLARGLRPDLVLLDGRLTGELDGLRMLARIREDSSLGHTRVIVFRPRGVHQDAPSDLDADACLAEEFSALELIETVGRLLPREVFGEPPGYDLPP